MFTGIIDHCGTINAIKRYDQAVELWINTVFDQLNIGESIAVDGVCLTVTDIKQQRFACTVSPETLAVTTLSSCQINQAVHLERALRLQDRLGGHWVTGHVDQIVTVSSIRHIDECVEVTLQGVTNEQLFYLAPKGCIALQGVSLTVNHMTQCGFNVMLIPHTLQQTHLNQLKLGSNVNVEFDLIAKHVMRQAKCYLANAPTVGESR